MSNGYKPAPYNLSTVTVNPKMERLVEQLAENAHNVWARDRMEQGWTYGLAEVSLYYVMVYFLVLHVAACDLP